MSSGDGIPTSIFFDSSAIPSRQIWNSSFVSLNTVPAPNLREAGVSQPLAQHSIGSIVSDT